MNNRYNLYFGILLFIVFLLTGFYMEVYFKPSHLHDIEQRLQIRSNHIYTLFVSLLNITASFCSANTTRRMLFYVDFGFRVSLICAGILAMMAFCFEHTGEISNRILTLFTVIFSLVSVCLLLFIKIIDKSKSTKSV